MEQLIELLKQIQDLSGVAIKALTEASGGHGGQQDGKPAEGSPAEEAAESPEEEAREQAGGHDDHGGGGRPPFGRH